ncbi:unnamed protein product, partial [Mesorhabditis spiculigera]
MGTNNAEFPPYANDADDVKLVPLKIAVAENKWHEKLAVENPGPLPVLYKLKATNNKRCLIHDCAGLIKPKDTVKIMLESTDEQLKTGDGLLLVYTQYTAVTGNQPVNAFVAWQRAKKLDIVTKTKSIALVKADK